MDLSQILLYAQVAFGIGLVIFVHELGHFLAARLCGVRVEVFSLGFGPRLVGWRRGATLYQIALLPLGGFVRMAGEERLSHASARPDELPAKSVGQRFFIYSGGVLMNVVFALVVFPIVLFIGVPFSQPLVGRVAPGGPAWRAGLQPGTRVLEVNGNPVVAFTYISTEVALGPPDAARLLVLEPGASEPREVVVEPRYDRELGLSLLDIAPALDPEMRLKVRAGSAAEEAGLRSDDRLIAVRGGLAGLSLSEQVSIELSDIRPLDLTVEREGQSVEVHLVPKTGNEKGRRILGVLPLYRRVQELRPNPDLAALGLRAGDRLLEVDGRPVRRLWDLERALLEPSDAELAASGPLTLRVERAGAELLLQGPANLGRERRVRLARDLALANEEQGTGVAVLAGSAAEQAGVQTGDRILRIDGEPVADWAELKERIEAHPDPARPLLLELERTSAEGASERVSLAAMLQGDPLPDYGFHVGEATYVYRARGLADAMRLGFQASWKFVVDAWQTVKRILFGQVSGKNVGGIITIAAVSTFWAEEGLAKLFFILCVLSMNLAFVNVLPIPVLDGGHLFFLAVEKLKGSPVSERVLGYSQVVGVVLILSLMVYVTYNDLKRWVFTE